MTKNDEFTRRVHGAEQHVERLSQQIDALNSQSSERRMLAEALLELTGALDVLRTADDQLEEEHQTLVVTREALEQERERFRHLFDYAPDGQIITDIRGRILRVNSAASLLIGVDPRYLVNKPLAVYIDPKHKPLFWSMLRNLQSRTISEAGESVIESSTGISIEVMIQAVRSESYDADKIHWHFQNISEQRHQDRVERDQYFRTTFENTTVGIAHIGSRGEWIRANQHLCDLFACTHDELLRLTFRDFIHPDHRSAAEETHRQLVTGEKDSVVVEQRYLRRDKRDFWALVSYTAVRSAQGLYLYTIAVINDITDRLTIEAIEREQRAIAEVLRDTALLLTRTLNLPTIIDTIRESIGRLVPHDFAVVLLTDGERASVMEQNEPPTPSAQDGNGMVRTLSWRIADIPVLQSMFETQNPIVVPQWQDDSAMTTALDLKSMRSFVGAPIVVRSDVLGFVLLYCRQAGFFGEQHAQLLKVFASQAASAVQNARAYEQAQTLAVIGERQRLARELHDAVSQTLFSASIVAETLPRLWKGMPDPVERQLGQLQVLTRGALAEMRTLLLELRPDKLPHINMPTQLQQLTDALKARKHINIRLETRDNQHTPIEVRIALYRIAQEALNNVAKHAEATELLVQWEASATRARLVIQDDGHGFRIDEQAGANSFGLQSMKERAQQIQADFHVRSTRGRGTTIRVKWKAQAQER